MDDRSFPSPPKIQDSSLAPHHNHQTPAAPQTPPHHRGPPASSGFTASLLHQFGSRSSPSSVTKARKASQLTADHRHHFSPPDQTHSFSPSPLSTRIHTVFQALEPPSTPTANMVNLRPRSQRSYAEPPDPEPLSTQSPGKPVWSPDRAASPGFVPNENQGEDDHDEYNNSSDASPRQLRQVTDGEVLKMDTSKRAHEGVGLRRSARNAILISDTIVVVPRAKPKPPRKEKSETARTRLREKIEAQTVPKMNAYILAHKDCFLQLLPEDNYITKLDEPDAYPNPIPYSELSAQPKGIRATLKPYQLSGLSFLVHLHKNGMPGILGDEMGLGKTLQTLSLFQYLEEQDRASGISAEQLRPYLVICPLSVLGSWVAEAQKWVPELKVVKFQGSPAERDRLKALAYEMDNRYVNDRAKGKNFEGETFKILVTTYECFMSEKSWFQQAFAWRYCVLDEGHKVKNAKTNVSKALVGLQCEYRLALTGTPLQNNLVEIWSLFHWLFPKIFTKPTEKLFIEAFKLSQGKVDTTVMDRCRRLLEVIMLRRMKNSPGVNLGLPPKEEILLYVPLTPLQKLWYKRLLTGVGAPMLQEVFSDIRRKEKDDMAHEKLEDALLARVGPDTTCEETPGIVEEAFQKPGDNKGAWTKLMNLILQLRKCCTHPYLIEDAEPDPDRRLIGQHLIHASGKFIVLEKLLRDLVLKQGKKVLIFSGFKMSLDLVQDLLFILSDGGAKFGHLRIDGGVAGARRNLDMRMFNDPSMHYKIMLLSTRAGGLGITLTAATEVIFLDEDWNPQQTAQAEARAHRIGQTKKVTVYKLCTQGTVEEQMMGRIQKKLYLSVKITETMRSVHMENSQDITENPTFSEEAMGALGSSQLKTLLRRGAQTLSRPQIDVTEMLRWDLKTTLEKCREKPAEIDPSASATDEKKWLSIMEKVECAIFDGERHQRCQDEANMAILPASITRADRRKGKNTTVMVDGFAVDKKSTKCGEWEAVPTLAGKDPSLADYKVEKRKYEHEDVCHQCFTVETSSENLVICKGCPRAYHKNCLDSEYQAKVGNGRQFFCPQHKCVACKRGCAQAGGLLLRCRWCPRAYCDECVNWEKTVLIGDNLPEFEVLGEEPAIQAFHIKCSHCVEWAAADKGNKKWFDDAEKSYRAQFKKVMAQRKAERKWEEQKMLRGGPESNGGVTPKGKKLNALGVNSPPGVADASGRSSPPPLPPTPTPAKRRGSAVNGLDTNSSRRKKTKLNGGARNNKA